jgi:Flp pilus assembly protein TadG
MLKRPAGSMAISLRQIAAAARTSGGNAAVEFALILPLMLTLYFGSVEITQGIRASRKVDLVASALANLASEQLTCASNAATVPCLADADMTGSNGIFTAASAIISPYSTTNLKMTVSQVTISTVNGSLQAKVNWSVTNNGGTARPCTAGGPNGSLLAGNVAAGSTNYQNYLPTSYTQAGAPTGSMIVADVTYQYTPGYGYQLFKWSNATTALNMANVGYYRNRNSNNGNAGPITAAMTSGLTTCP